MRDITILEEAYKKLNKQQQLAVLALVMTLKSLQTVSLQDLQ